MVSFVSIFADAYIGLSDEQALRLAQRHNLNPHFVHKITYQNCGLIMLSCHKLWIMYAIAIKILDYYITIQ